MKIYSESGAVSEFTYQQLQLDIAKVQDHYQSRFENIDEVILISENNYEMIVVYFALLLNGISVVLLNPTEGLGRLKSKIELFKPNHLMFNFAKLELPDSIELNEVQKIIKGDPRPTKSVSSPSEIDHARLLNHPIVKVMTSGSTGLSKVVPLSEANVISNVSALIEHHQIDQDTIILTSLPLFHVNALFFSLMCTVSTGAQLILVEKNQFHLFEKALSENPVQIVSLMPSIIRLLEKKMTSNSAFNHIKYFVSAAAPLASDLCLKVFSKTGKKIIQGYGLSEAVNFSATLPIDITDQDYQSLMINSAQTSIGCELNYNQITIQLESGHLAKEDEIGELVLNGWNLMFGYQGDNFSGLVELGFRTGDLGFFRVLRGRKYFFITGRKKDVIKRNGETVSLREIDDYWIKLMPENCDVISVGFKNHYTDEDWGLVIQTEASLTDQAKIDLVDKLFVQVADMFYKPKVVVTVSSSIRTRSGKPLRWMYQPEFEEYSHSLLTQNTIFRILTSK